MRQCWSGMAGEHRSHTVCALDDRSTKAQCGNGSRSVVNTRAPAGTGLAAIGGRMTFALRRGHGHGLLVGSCSCLVVLIAGRVFGHGGLGWRWGFHRSHMAQMHRRRRRCHPIERQGDGEKKAQQDGPKGHAAYFNLPPESPGTGNVNSGGGQSSWLHAVGAAPRTGKPHRRELYPTLRGARFVLPDSTCLRRSFFWRRVRSFHCNSNSASSSSSV